MPNESTTTTNDESCDPVELERCKAKALWQTHSIQRGAEYEFKFKTVYEAWQRSVEAPLSKKQQAYKFKKYGMRSLQSKYFWDEQAQILFTVHVAKNGQWYVVTITKGRGNWSV